MLDPKGLEMVYTRNRDILSSKMSVCVGWGEICEICEREREREGERERERERERESKGERARL